MFKPSIYCYCLTIANQSAGKRLNDNTGDINFVKYRGAKEKKTETMVNQIVNGYSLIDVCISVEFESHKDKKLCN